MRKGAVKMFINICLTVPFTSDSLQFANSWSVYLFHALRSHNAFVILPMWFSLQSTFSSLLQLLFTGQK